MSFPAFHIGAGAVLVYTAARTGFAIVLSVRGHRRGESAASLVLQSVSDGILAIGALLYANAALRPDAPRVVMAALLIYAITWEAYVGASRVEAIGSSPEDLHPLGVEGFLDAVQVGAWIFMTFMLIAFCGIVVATRPVLTDAQKLAPIVGVFVPIAVGLMLRGYVSDRNHEGWRAPDTVALILAGSTLAFACWAWL